MHGLRRKAWIDDESHRSLTRGRPKNAAHFGRRCEHRVSHDSGESSGGCAGPCRGDDLDVDSRGHRLRGFGDALGRFERIPDDRPNDAFALTRELHHMGHVCAHVVDDDISIAHAPAGPLRHERGVARSEADEADDSAASIHQSCGAQVETPAPTIVSPNLAISICVPSDGR